MTPSLALCLGVLPIFWSPIVETLTAPRMMEAALDEGTEFMAYICEMARYMHLSHLRIYRVALL